MTAATRTLDWLAQSAQGAWLVPPATGATFVGATTDSRQVTSNIAFVALAGERVDGFDYCAPAAAAGAAVLIVPAARGLPKGTGSTPVLGVDDPLTALGRLGEALRNMFQGRVVAVTGSNGKTTTKELIAAALGPAVDVCKTPGNYNTDVGLPLTLLGSTGKERFWVLEMAMRAAGEISYLTNLARPHVAVVTNIGVAHLGRLGSLQGIADAKGEIFEGLVPDGLALIPDQEPLLLPSVRFLRSDRCQRFGTRLGGGCDLAVSVLDCVPAGAAGSVVRYAVGDDPVLVNLPLSGVHNAVNGGIALAVAVALGISAKDAAAGLERVELPPHRSRPLAMADRVVLDDCYNANPSSMIAALQAVVAGSRGTGRAFAVLGDMLELGADEVAMHEQLGRDLVAAGLAGVVGVGALGSHIARVASVAGMALAVQVAEPAEAAQLVSTWTAAGDWILIKGSRGASLERVIAALQILWADEITEDQSPSTREPV